MVTTKKSWYNSEIKHKIYVEKVIKETSGVLHM